MRSLGAHKGVLRGDDFSAHVRGLVPEGVDGLVDATLLHETALGAVHDEGGLAAVREFPGENERGISSIASWFPAMPRHRLHLRAFGSSRPTERSPFGWLALSALNMPERPSAYSPEAGYADVSSSSGDIR